MPRKRTPLSSSNCRCGPPADERACAIMLEAARNIGNAVLGEGLRRLDLMRESKAYQAARKMSRGEPRSPARKARATAFQRLFEAFGLTGHSLQKFAQACRDNCWIKDHLPGTSRRRPPPEHSTLSLQYTFDKRGRPGSSAGTCTPRSKARKLSPPSSGETVAADCRHGHSGNPRSGQRRAQAPKALFTLG
jgi:hypothetical protein